jgi:hypothetical protein
MATTTHGWKPSADEVRRIVAELAPVIDACVARSEQQLARRSAADVALTASR